MSIVKVKLKVKIGKSELIKSYKSLDNTDLKILEEWESASNEA